MVSREVLRHEQNQMLLFHFRRVRFLLRRDGRRELRSTCHKPLTNRNKELFPVAQLCTASAHQCQAQEFPKGVFFGEGFHTLIIAQTDATRDSDKLSAARLRIAKQKKPRPFRRPRLFRMPERGW
jgi:hypothetical protein